MNIGCASELSDLPAKTIRYYEEIGLVSPDRSSNGYRDYNQRDIEALQFLRKARGLGFSVDDCRQLLALQSDETRASQDVRALASGHIEEITARIAQLEEMRVELQALVKRCRGDQNPQCAILDAISAHN
ncbi:MerR family DNA-binding protein [Limoniibacter endophyticus]|uniref:Cu(I)-responsive transcriptional regulator n=1 Tax=Limoniibacter endophyticus TaxID=1565040 RepID=A0A8J3GFG3_9HYPH|nr:MerR family DNA-binding protein [Limoniibacter endophyticus]GHC66811.1 Cu(I)-responsive transcriptional regulator [Limoniibacter endophyticus]